jgi:hypothetical protein
MAKTKLRAGEEIDTLSREELRQELSKQARDLLQEQARGVSTFDFQDAAAVAGGLIVLPSGSSLGYGPEAGFCWAVQRISVAGLATNDVVGIYRDAVVDKNFVGQVTSTSPVFKPGSKGLILRGGQRLLLSGGSLAATGFISVNSEGIEIAETDLYKLL